MKGNEFDGLTATDENQLESAMVGLNNALRAFKAIIPEDKWEVASTTDAIFCLPVQGHDEELQAVRDAYSAVLRIMARISQKQIGYNLSFGLPDAWIGVFRLDDHNPFREFGDGGESLYRLPFEFARQLSLSLEKTRV